MSREGPHICWQWQLHHQTHVNDTVLTSRLDMLPPSAGAVCVSGAGKTRADPTAQQSWLNGHDHCDLTPMIGQRTAVGWVTTLTMAVRRCQALCHERNGGLGRFLIPERMVRAPSMTAFMPDAHTLFTSVQLAADDRPAWRAACRPGACKTQQASL